MPATVEEIRAHIVAPGSMVIFELPESITADTFEAIRGQIAAEWPAGIPHLIVGGGVRVFVAAKDGE